MFVQQNLLLGGSFAGNIYAKWGHVILAGKGDYDSAIVAGTMRLIALLDMEITPSRPLPPAYDVFLVE